MNIEEAVNSGGVHGAAEGMNQYLTFIMAEEEYAVDILRVQEIKGWDVATALPNTPDYVRGVINLRGTIVPIIDLRQRFGLDSIQYGATTVVIVLKVLSDAGERIMGVVVDAVSEVYNVSPDEIKPAPSFGEVQKEVVKGLATVENKMIIILDIDQLLNERELQMATASQ
ncbi:MAG: purine-binding chemotaxis protein CheW [Gammaproteobacteria bacterium]|nr:purine-binding chemotaxis protein CheW [Gammaproteobacteria bacterium]